MAANVASKVRTGSRPGWSITFRHPVLRDARGRPGRRIRRGLGTTDAAEADRLVAELNQLLADESWWTSARRHDAEVRFAKPIVDAFYDELATLAADPWDIRGAHIALPSHDDRYCRVLFVGTTGAGKTSLLRHLIGSDPNEDRFPSTSTAKTTIADTEVILADGPYRAVVTFASHFMVQANVEDCVLNACTAMWDGEDEAKVADRLLNHPDQRFRMGYVLGAWSTSAGTADDGEDWSFGDEPDTTPADDAGVTEEERIRNQKVLAGFLERIGRIYHRCLNKVSEDFRQDVTQLIGRDRDDALEFLQLELQEDSELGELVHDIVDAMLERFKILSAGELRRRGDGWPDVWLFETKDRVAFIREVRWFSSNFAQDFGRLLTPLVDGIRVAGPLYPKFTDHQPRLALLDGQGLGHTPDSASSVTTHVTRRFGEVDVILLVDSAQQPMQAAPLSVLRIVAASGNYEKLAVAFTHFDLVKGPNLPNVEAKRTHVLASVRNGVSALRDMLGTMAASALERALLPRCFLLGGLDIATKKLPRGVVSELDRLLQTFAAAIHVPERPEAEPIYDTTGVLFAVQLATRKFHDPWLARLGLEAFPGVSKEHWTRIKALAKRLNMELDEYDSLKPLADVQERLMEEISKFLDTPDAWKHAPASEEEAQKAIAVIKMAVFDALRAFLRERMIPDALKEWREAYGRTGRGSTAVRAHDISEIYDAAAPVPGTIVTNDVREFLAGVRAIVHAAIEKAGGEIRISVTA